MTDEPCPEHCYKCGGKGWFEVPVGDITTEYICDLCNGAGNIPKPEPCPVCHSHYVRDKPFLGMYYPAYLVCLSCYHEWPASNGTGQRKYLCHVCKDTGGVTPGWCEDAADRGVPLYCVHCSGTGDTRNASKKEGV